MSFTFPVFPFMVRVLRLIDKLFPIPESWRYSSVLCRRNFIGFVMVWVSCQVSFIPFPSTIFSQDFLSFFTALPATFAKHCVPTYAWICFWALFSFLSFRSLIFMSAWRPLWPNRFLKSLVDQVVWSSHASLRVF